MSDHLLPETVSQGTFRNAMARLGAAVSIITTDGPAGRHGLTASAVCSVTDTPPTLLVCVNRQAGAHDPIAENGVLCVNVLTGEHEPLARLFGRPGVAPAERFAAAGWDRLATGAPVLADAAIALDGRVADTRQVGTHTVFFVEVAGVVLADDPAGLVYFDRAFHPLGRSVQARPGPVPAASAHS